jgi:hypothetical protein
MKRWRTIDVTALEKMMSEDFTFVTPRGDLRTRQTLCATRCVVSGNVHGVVWGHHASFGAA